MEQVNHTSGPWVRTIEHDLSVYGELEEGDRDTTVTANIVLRNPDFTDMAIIVTDINSPNNWDDDLLEANANLVAAAPDMLATLQGLESSMAAILHSDTRRAGPAALIPEWLTEIRAAVSKATGAA